MWTSTREAGEIEKPGKKPKTFPAPSLGASLFATVILAGSFAVIATLVSLGVTQSTDTSTLIAVDSALPDSLFGAMILFTTLGYYRYCAIAAIVAAAVFFLLGWRTSAAALLVSTFGGMAATTLLKYLFGRDRPGFIDSGYSAGYLSFPSGHATMAVGFYVILAAIIFLHLSGAGRWFVLVAGVIAALAIGLSRMYLGVHYPTDIIAGFLVSPTILAVFFAVYAAFANRKSRKNRKTKL